MGEVIDLASRIKSTSSRVNRHKKDPLRGKRFIKDDQEQLYRQGIRKKDRLVLRMLIADPSEPCCIEDITARIPQGSNIFLPLYEDQVFHPELTRDPGFYSELIHKLKGNNIFTTTVMPLYKQCKRPLKEDWLMQIKNIFHAHFQCTRIMTINYGQKVLDENPEWKTGPKVYLGTEEEVLHTMIRLGHFAMAKREGSDGDSSLDVPAIIPPHLTGPQVAFCSYVSQLEEKVYSVDPEKGLPRYIPKRPKEGFLRQRQGKIRFTNRMAARRDEQIHSLQDIMRRISQQYSCQDRKVHEYMPVALKR